MQNKPRNDREHKEMKEMLDKLYRTIEENVDKYIEVIMQAMENLENIEQIARVDDDESMELYRDILVQVDETIKYAEEIIRSDEEVVKRLEELSIESEIKKEVINKIYRKLEELEERHDECLEKYNEGLHKLEDLEKRQNKQSLSYTKDEPLNINSLKNTLFNLFKETPKDEDEAYAKLLGDLRNRGIVNTNQLEQIIHTHWKKALKLEQLSNGGFFSHCELVRIALETEFGDEKFKKEQEGIAERSGTKGLEVYYMYKRTLEKAKKCGGDPWYEYRKRGILPEKFDYGMNCLLDRWAEHYGEEVVQKVYDELKKDPKSYELDVVPHHGCGDVTGYDGKMIPVLFGVICMGIEAFNRAAKIPNLEREFIPALDKDPARWSAREVLYAGNMIYHILLREKQALDEVDRELWIVQTWYIREVLGEDKFCRWLIETKGNLQAPVVKEIVKEAVDKYIKINYDNGRPESLAYYEEKEKKSRCGMVGALYRKGSLLLTKLKE